MLSAIKQIVATAKAVLTNQGSDVLVTMQRFVQLTQLVIDGLESGYYHPNMKAKYSLKNQKKLGDSGETLFGLDRKHGANPLATYPEWKEFWSLVDAAGAANKWPHYYIPVGDIGAKLKELAAKIMYRWFSALSKKYISNSAAAVIADDDRLILHFSYASWNGEVWFRRYAIALNAAVKNYYPSKERMFQDAFKVRSESSNPTIRQQAVNMQPLFKKLLSNNG